MSNKKDNVSKSLIKAVKDGALESVKELVHSHGLSYCEGWQEGYALLCDAVKFNHVGIAEFLLEEGAKINCETGHVDTPLHLASKQWRTELIQLLLAKGALIDARNAENETALHLAAKENLRSVVEVLLHNNASLTVQNEDGLTPLLLAVKGRHSQVVRTLLQHARTNLKDENLDMPSASVPKKRNVSLLNRILLCNPRASNKVNKAVVTIVTHDKPTDNDHFKIVDDLLDHGFILDPEYMNRSLLLAAVKNNYVKFVDYILRNGAKPNDSKHNPLHAAVENKHKDIVSVILNAGLDREAKDIDAKHYLMLLKIAVENGHLEIVKLFLNAGFNAKDEERPLYIEEDKCVEVIRLLLANGADLTEAPELLPAVVELGLVKVCELLIENGADVNARKRGLTALHTSCAFDSRTGVRQEENEIVKLLLNSGADVNIKASIGHTAFHIAASAGRKEAVNIFLDFGVDVDLRAEDGSTPLHVASERGRTEIIEILLKNRANVDACREDGSTPLHLTEDCNTIKILLANKANVDARRNDGLTPLLHAAGSMFNESPISKIKMLLQCGADIDARGSKNQTALHFFFSTKVAHWWDVGVVTSLLDSGCDINAETGRRKTALKRAISRFISNRGNFFNAIEPLKTLVRYMIKLKAAGLYVSERNLRLINGLNDEFYLEEFVSHELPSFQQTCEAEVRQLKNEKVDSSCTLYDVLAKFNNLLCTRNKWLMFNLKSLNFKEFPIYRSLILNNLQRSETRLRLLNSGQRALDILVKTSNKLNEIKYLVLPAEILEQIVSYLRNIELNSLISCSEALKRQLKCQSGT